MIDHSALVAWWPLESSPDHLKGPAGLTTTAQSTPAYDEVMHGRGMVFDQEQRLACNQKVVPMGAKSVELWLRTHDTPGSQSGYVIGNAKTTSDRGLRVLLLTSGEFQFTMARGQAGNLNFECAYGLESDSLYHIVGTWDGGTGADGAKLYVNGRLASTDTAQSTGEAQDFNLRIGAWTSSTLRLKADLDEIRIWNRALGPGDVRRLMLNLHPIAL